MVDDAVVTLREYVEAQDGAPRCRMGLQGARARTQAVFACQSAACRAGCATGVAALGVCRACSLLCHAACEVVDVGRRRNFACDCKCARRQQAGEHRNKYDERAFRGAFCRCTAGRPSPDDAWMVQCVPCEGWLHWDCLVLPSGSGDGGAAKEEVAEVVCRECIGAHPYLARCAAAGPPPEGETVDDDDDDVDVTAVEAVCLTAGDASAAVPFDVPLPIGWRRAICRCGPCQALLAASGLSFLHDDDDDDACEDDDDDDDAIVEGLPYEAALALLAPSAAAQQGLSKGIAALSTFKDRFSAFLAAHSESSRVITREDVQAFLSTLA